MDTDFSASQTTKKQDRRMRKKIQKIYEENIFK